MVKETILFHDLEGNEITRDFYFNMFATEVAEWNFSKEGGLAERIQKLNVETDQGEIIKLLKEIILKSYGHKGEDGIQFIKTEEDAIAFSQTEAFQVLFLKLAQDENEAARFINGIMPPMPTDNKPAVVTTKKATKK